jgi:hypothetical protein
MQDENEPEKGKRKRRHRLGEPRPGPRTADLGFSDILGAILDADPEAVRDHKAARKKERQKRRGH